MYPVTYWRWVDIVAQNDRLEQNRRDGPFEGQCPSCGALARAHAAWVEIDLDARHAVLVLPEDRRGHVIDELQQHLETLRRRPEGIASWLLHPAQRFVGTTEEDTARRRIHRRAEAGAEDRAGLVAGEVEVEGPVHQSAPSAAQELPALSSSAFEADDEAEETTVSASAASGEFAPGVPQPIGAEIRRQAGVPRQPAALGAFLGELVVLGGRVIVRVEMAAEAGAKWNDAKLDARPIHLRGRGYPLLGVRIVGAHVGAVGIIDAVLDAGDPTSAEAFRALAQRFVVTLEGRVGGTQTLRREVEAPGMEPNAALCIESARGLLAHGEYPPEDFDNARRRLGEESVEDRIAPTKVTIAPGAYAHIVGAREAVAAMEHLDRVSRKEYLSRLLEVDGLPMGEYDAIRRRVLQGSLDHGLIAPRRFWRRVVASGLANDYEDYAGRLAANRARCEGDEGDLDPEQARAAWEGIYDLCRRKDIELPAEVRAALNLSDGELYQPPARRSAAGVIGGEPGEIGAKLRDPNQRLKVATDVIQGRIGGGDIDLVFGALDAFDTDELLAILPDLSELGARATTGLTAKLEAERREVRQAAVILLGMSLDPDALEPLADLLVREPTTVWLDVARALGSFGPVALRRLCQILRRESGTPNEQRTIERVARSLAEIALSDDDVGPGGPSPGHDAVAALADAGDPRVSAAARRALATLRDVRESGAAIRGEVPLSENTEIRGFARRAYEAIMVPELEVEVEA